MATRRRTMLVAGGAGFVGSHLCAALLDRGDRVVCVDNLWTGLAANVEALAGRDLRFVRADVVDPLSVDEPLDGVFNLACPASPPAYQADPVRTMLTNVAGTANLLQLAARHGARFVQASTSEVYGDPAVHPQPESYVGHVAFTGPRGCYDEGKRAAETLCADLSRSGAVDVRVARIFNTYGTRMRADDGRIVSNLIVQALTQAPLTIYGSGTQTRSFCHVSDLVDGLMRLMDRDAAPDGPVNLGNPEEVSILDLAERVRSLVPTRSPIVFHPLPRDDPRRRCPDIARARRLLGWSPRVPLAEGLPRTIDWFASTLAAAAPEPRARPAR